MSPNSIVFENVITTADNANLIFFAVRAEDNAGATEQRLDLSGENVDTRFFEVNRNLNGPCVNILSNIIGSWNCNSPPSTRDVFARQGLRFEWGATPGVSGAAILTLLATWLPLRAGIRKVRSIDF